MTKEMLKNIIVEKREAGMTFEEISEYLKNNYNIDRSRQAIHGLYQRAEKDEKCAISADAKYDIYVLTVLGYSKNRIHEILDISSYYIGKILDDTVQLEKVKQTYILKVYKLLEENKNVNEIIKSLTYKSVEPTERGVKVLVSDALSEILSIKLNSALASISELGVNNETIQRGVGLFKQKYSIPTEYIRGREAEDTVNFIKNQQL